MPGLYVIIAGAGKVGWNLARELLEKGHEVTLIESSRPRYLTIEEEFEHSVQYGDATELWVLERAGIQRADLVVAVTGDDEDEHGAYPSRPGCQAGHSGGVRTPGPTRRPLRRGRRRPRWSDRPPRAPRRRRWTPTAGRPSGPRGRAPW